MITLHNLCSFYLFIFPSAEPCLQEPTRPAHLIATQSQTPQFLFTFGPASLLSALDVFRDLRIAFLQANLGQCGVSDRLLNIHREGGEGGCGGGSAIIYVQRLLGRKRDTY